jgi:uncharacterized protein (TIGR02611 family)
MDEGGGMRDEADHDPTPRRTPYEIARRWVRIIMGFTVILIGLVLAIPGIPGPGALIIFGGLAVLATEYAWARRYLQKFKKGGEKLGAILFGKKKTPQ